jgi:hypothetical protein
MKQDAFVVVRTGAMVHYSKRVRDLKNPLARGRGSTGQMYRRSYGNVRDLSGSGKMSAASRISGIQVVRAFPLPPRGKEAGCGERR